MKKIQELEAENLTFKTRLESLENWALKITENVGHDAFNRDKEIISFQSKLGGKRKCKVCKETFSRNCELENHMVNIHASEKTHGCETIGKTFVLKWRLEKHLAIHEESVKTCKFFKEGKECPFEDIGCKFSHIDIDKERRVAAVVTRNETMIVKSTASTTLVEKHDDEEATDKKVEEGGTNTGNGERYLDPNISLYPLEKSQPFFDLDNPNVYPPIVYPQNIQTVYHQNPCTVYPQNPHIMYPQDLKTRTAGTSSLPSFDEIFPPHYIPPRSNSSAFWKP